jgi:hypothetical protein
MFSFEEWLEWWGDDLDRRGTGHDQLQMQRIGDQGPYAPGNVRKGYPMDNRKTAGQAERVRNGTKRRSEMEREAMGAEPLPTPEDRGMTDDEWELHRMFAPRSFMRAY